MIRGYENLEARTDLDRVERRALRDRLAREYFWHYGYVGLWQSGRHEQALAAKKMNGKINPFSVLKALYYSKKIRDLRILLLGIKKQYRSKGVDALLFREGFKGVRSGGYRRVEFSWILGTISQCSSSLICVGGRLYNKYRIYERSL